MNFDGIQLNQSDALSGLRDVRREFEALDEKVLRLVTLARQLDATWQQIGDALGMSRQTVWARYAAMTGAEQAGSAPD